MKPTATGAATGEDGHAWPFAVSRTKHKDWRPVMAPGHMIAQGGEYLLVHASDPGDLPSPSPVFERVVTTKRYGDLTLVARSLPATADLIGGSPKEQLLDGAGRPIQLIEGLVLHGRHRDCSSRWQDQLPSVHTIAQQVFPEFWRSEDEAAPPAPSQPLTQPGPTAHPGSEPGQITDDEVPAGSTIPAATGRLNTGGSGKPPARCVLMEVIATVVGMAILHVLIRMVRR
jgi:hypothetical protein